MFPFASPFTGDRIQADGDVISFAASATNGTTDWYAIGGYDGGGASSIINRYPFTTPFLIFAGIGNYIRAEMIYDTKIDPFCIFGDLGKPLIKKLFLSFRKIVYKSYLYQKGKGSFEFNSYGRKDKKNIKRIVLNYRTFWYDPNRIKYKC